MDTILQKPYCVIGIVNVTPDSFFDGGKYNAVDLAVKHAQACIEKGADCIDIGGESTRPGSEQVSAEDECARIVPVVKQLVKVTTIPISIDTTKSYVAKATLDEGATMINDISAGRFDPAMASVIAKARCLALLMHSRQTPKTMQEQACYTDVVAEVKQELLACVTTFVNAGVKKENIVLDPGIGFAKRLEDNLTLLSHCKDLIDLGFPLCIGTSRKSFLGSITGQSVDNRLAGSLATVANTFLQGATIFRVHDVKATVDVLKVLQAIKTHHKN